MEFHKKVDKSFFEYGFTIPKDYEKYFLAGQPIKAGAGRDVSIVWKNKPHRAVLRHVARKAGPVHQLRWRSSNDLTTAIKQTFIQSYIAIYSKDLVARREKKYFMTSLTGGNQEVACFKVLSPSEIKMSVYISVPTPYDELFRRLIQQDVFGWLGTESGGKMIASETSWLDLNELSQHADMPYVVYYLADDDRKEIYIGSAKRLGDRVKPGRREIKGWNRFRYEMLHRTFRSQLKEIEYHSIRNFSRFFKNLGGRQSLEVCDYRLVNMDYGRYRK